MQTKFNKYEREIYYRTIDALKELWQNTNPKINLAEIKEEIDPNDYSIPAKTFEEILLKHNVSITDNLVLFLNKAPKIIS